MFNKKNIKLIATFFYVGEMPLMPGSLASILGMFIYFALFDNIIAYVSIFIVITILGFYAGGRMESILNEKDPQCVVIDEVAGVMIAFFLLPITPAVAITTFFVFRAFDMFKIYPVNKFEKIASGTGIMMDDIIAGIYTNIVMHAAVYLTRMI